MMSISSRAGIVRARAGTMTAPAPEGTAMAAAMSGPETTTSAYDARRALYDAATPYADKASLACSEKDNTTKDMRRQGANAAVKVEAKKEGGVFKKLPATHPGIRAATAFLEQACGVNACHVSVDLAPWKSIVTAPPKKRFSVTKQNFVRFVDFCLGVGAIKTLPNDLKQPLG